MTQLADSHIHFFAGGYPGKYGPLFPKGGEFLIYSTVREVHHIQRSLIVGYEGDAWAKGNNQYIARLAQQHKWMVPLAFQSAPPTPKTLKSAWAKGFFGISIYVSEASDVDRLHQWSDEAVAELNEKRAIISINAPLGQLTGLRKFLERLPEASVLLSHLGLPEAIGSDTTLKSAKEKFAPLLALADLPQVGVKISAFYAFSAYPHKGLSPVINTIAKSFGPRRLYWGSDFSPALDTVSFPQTIQPVLDELARRPELAPLLSDNLNAVIDRVRPQ